MGLGEGKLKLLGRSRAAAARINEVSEAIKARGSDFSLRIPGTEKVLIAETVVATPRKMRPKSITMSGMSAIGTQAPSPNFDTATMISTSPVAQEPKPLMTMFRFQPGSCSER